MADIPASLLQTLNGPGPQYKASGQNKFQWVEGTNGAPFSQIVDANGNPITTANRLPVDAQLTGSIVELKTKPGVASDSWTTHQSVSVAPVGSATYVSLNVTGYRKGRVVIYSESGIPCYARLVANSRAGTAYNAEILLTDSTKANDTATVDLNGVDSIMVNVFNPDEINSNTITCDIFVQD